VLNSTEGAHIKWMSTFETDEHLREPRSPNAEAGTTSECWRTVCSPKGADEIVPDFRAVGLSDCSGVAEMSAAKFTSKLNKLDGWGTRIRT
jgi:hypothetical protein